MATIDPNIAMGYRPVQIENPLNQLAALTQIQTGQQGQQLNALKMQEAQLELEDRNALRGLDIGSPDFISNVSKRNPKLALALQKEMTLNKEAGLKNVGLETKNLTDRYKQEKDIFQYISTPEQFLARSINNLNDPLLGPQLKNAGVTEATIRQRLDAATKQPGGFQQLLNENILGLDKFIELNKPVIQNVTRGGISEQIQTPGLGGAPVVTRTAQVTATPGESMADARARERLAAELNPEIIRSKAENIRLGTLAAEQSPLAPKVIAANAGKDLVGDVATQMGNSYLKLFESGGIKSTTRGAAANLAARSQSSMLGQIGGSILGTENQSERDFIKSQRPILVQGIVKATGMTASQINSNVELKNLLDAATDPDKGYETNAKNLNLINKRFGTGKNIVPEKPNLATKTPDVEALLKKYE
jgi:hypothetical protein